MAFECSSEPYIEVLHYLFITLDTYDSFQGVPEWTGTLGPFTCALRSGSLEARPQEHYRDEQAARAVLDPLLASWEVRALLESDIRIRFDFQRAVLVKSASSGIPGMTRMAGSISGGLSVSGSPTRCHLAYPDPGDVRQLKATALVKDLLPWVRQLRSRQPPMLVPGYLLLTRLEWEYGKRAHAAKTLNVSRKILHKFGELTAVNDPLERRKIAGDPRSLTEREKEWLIQAAALLTTRVAEFEAGATTTSLLNMSNLPALADTP